MYDQPQPNYATQPHYGAPAHVVGNGRRVDWRLTGAYIVGALGVGCAIVCLWFLSSFKQVYASQMTQMNRALATARTTQAESAGKLRNLSAQIRSAQAELILLTPYSSVCSQYLTGPNGGPSTFDFPCSMQRPGS